jgi:hypothetical protein
VFHMVQITFGETGGFTTPHQLGRILIVSIS